MENQTCHPTLQGPYQYPDHSQSYHDSANEDHISDDHVNDYIHQLFAAAHEQPPLSNDAAQHSNETVLTDEGNSTADSLSNRANSHIPSPAALLNPRASTKRPASESDSAREDLSDSPGGQVSLVERLHNVHARTASPAKRFRTGDDQDLKQQPPKPTVQSGSTLSLQRHNGTKQQGDSPTPTAVHSESIDLTMSKSCRLLRSAR
jgi:hypothetical protein